MSSPSSLCVCRWGQGSEGRWKVGEHANFIFNFAPSREIDEEFSGVLVPSSPSDGLGICFAFSVCFMRPFHIYLLLFPSVSRACLLFLPPPPPALPCVPHLVVIVREIERKSSAQNVDVEMKFNLTFLLTQFCVSSESGFWPKRRMYQSYKWIYRLARVCLQTDTHTNTQL